MRWLLPEDNGLSTGLVQNSRMFSFICTSNLKTVLRFFRINDPYRLLAILLFLFLFSLPFLIGPPGITKPELKAMLVGEALNQGQQMYSEVYDSTPPLSAAVFACLDWTMGRSVMGRQVFALFLIFFQAAFFAIVLINTKAYNDNTYVPGFIYALLCFVSFDFLSVNPALLGSTVLLLALNNLFREIEFRVERDETVFKVGFYSGLASLFVFTYGIFMVAAIVILTIYSRNNLRKTLLTLVGFLLPHLVLNVWYYYRDELPALWTNFYAENLFHTDLNLVSLRTLLLISALPLVYFVFSLFMMTREARFTKYQSQLFQVMFLWLIVCVVELFVTRQLSPHSLIIAIPSLSYFFSYYLLLIRRKWIAETALWVLIVGVISVAVLAGKGKISAIDYYNLMAPAGQPNTSEQKKIMVLDDDLSLYRSNQLGGYFLDWAVSQRALSRLDEYEEVLRLDNMFKQHPPDEIIDPSGVLPSVMARVPAVEKAYRKVGPDRYLRK